MTSLAILHRRRLPRPASVRQGQGGAALRGLVVAVGLVAAVVLQVAGPRLQSGLAGLVGFAGTTPAAVPAAATPRASMPSCGSWSAANPAHPCKIARATATGIAPVL